MINVMLLMPRMFIVAMAITGALILLTGATFMILYFIFFYEGMILLPDPFTTFLGIAADASAFVFLTYALGFLVMGEIVTGFAILLGILRDMAQKANTNF